MKNQFVTRENTWEKGNLPRPVTECVKRLTASKKKVGFKKPIFVIKLQVQCDQIVIQRSILVPTERQTKQIADNCF